MYGLSSLNDSHYLTGFPGYRTIWDSYSQVFEAQRKCQLFCEAFFSPFGAFSDSLITFTCLALQCMCSLLADFRSFWKYRREWDPNHVIFLSRLYSCSYNSTLYTVPPTCSVELSNLLSTQVPFVVCDDANGGSLHSCHVVLAHVGTPLLAAQIPEFLL